MTEVNSEIMVIMFIDVAGYTKMTTRLPREEFDKFHEIFDNISIPLFQKYNGRVVKKIGDAFMVIFKSATDAVLCGMELQNTFMRNNKERSLRFPINIRVALHMGEVLNRHDDIYGDAVNTTARIEGVAKEGHIVFSETVFSAMNKTEIPFVYLGAFRMKGLKYPIKLFRVKGSFEDVLKRRATKRKESKNAFLWFWVLVLLFLLGVLLFYTILNPKIFSLLF